MKEVKRDQEDPQPDFFPEEEDIIEERPSFFRTLFFSTVAFVVLASFLWWTGGANIFRYRETPVIEQQPVESTLEAETLTLPINVIVFRSDGELGSQRDQGNIQRLVTNTSQIWAQADIALLTDGIHDVLLDDDVLNGFLDDPAVLIQDIPSYDPGAINLFLMRKLRGINGIAFTGLQSAAVADITTVYDFRATAHEVGHLLKS